MKSAPLFQSGQSQAVRLPKECHFTGTEVYIRVFEDMVILFPKESSWTPLFRSLDMFSDDFMEERAFQSDGQEQRDTRPENHPKKARRRGK